MEDEKNVRQQAYQVGSPTESQSNVADQFGSNDLDKINMQRMGKDQEMKRVFRQVSLISFTAIIMGTWQWMLMANTQGLIAGGRGGLFWSYVWTFVGYAFLAASLADMASMAPTAGGTFDATTLPSSGAHTDNAKASITGYRSSLRHASSKP